MPLFALANAGVVINSSVIFNPVVMAVALGLFIGKPIGITLFSWLAVKSGWPVYQPAELAGCSVAAHWPVSALPWHCLSPAWPSRVPCWTRQKVGILIGSFLSALVGSAMLLILLKKPQKSIKSEIQTTVTKVVLFYILDNSEIQKIILSL